MHDTRDSPIMFKKFTHYASISIIAQFSYLRSYLDPLLLIYHCIDKKWMTKEKKGLQLAIGEKIDAL